MTPLLSSGARTDRAFERLYRHHVGDVYRYSLAVLRNPADAEDVTQTTFLNAYRAFARGERPEKPQNWLITIAHNVCRQRFRQTSRRPAEVELNEDITQATVPEDDAPTAEDIQRALEHLAFNQRSALVMRELEGRSYLEISVALGITVSAVETLLFRARRALREQLEGALTCDAAELAISRQLDGRLPRKERGGLRAHLRECNDCARLARSQRAQQSAWRALSLVPLPSTLASFFGGGAAVTGGAGAGITAALITKTAVVTAAGALIAGAGYETVKHPPWQPATAKREAVAQPPSAPSARARTTPPAAVAPVTPPAPSPPPASPAAPVVVPHTSERPQKAKNPKQKPKPRKPKPEQAKRAKPEQALGKTGRKHERPPATEVSAPVGLAKSESKARGEAKHAGKRVPASPVGLARTERHARNEARRAARERAKERRRPAKPEVPAKPNGAAKPEKAPAPPAPPAKDPGKARQTENRSTPHKSVAAPVPPPPAPPVPQPAPPVPQPAPPPVPQPAPPSDEHGNGKHESK